MPTIKLRGLDCDEPIYAPLRAVVACESEDCNREATVTFTDNGKLLARKCARCARRVKQMLTVAGRIQRTGVPGDVAVDWAAAYVARKSEAT